MLSMTEKALLGLAVTLGVVFAGILVLPVWTYEARLSTSPSSSNISVPRGRPFNITCNGDSNLKGNFKNMIWLNPKAQKMTKGVKQVEKDILLLTIEDPKETDSGVYKCLATYDNQNMEIHVSIKFYGPRPEFDSGYEVVQAQAGDRVELYCQATGEEPLKYEWFDKNEETISSNNASSVHILTSFNESILIMDKVQPNDGGVYMCTCSNAHGMSNKLFELRVGSSDGNDTLIRNVKARKINATSVEFSIWASQSVSSIEVKYIEDQNRNNPKYVSFRKGAVYEINGLIPAGLYTFQFRSESASPDGNGDWTNTLEVTLLPLKPDVILRSIGGDSVKIQWVEKSDDFRRKTIDKYQIRYYPVTLKGDIWEPSSCATTVEVPFCARNTYTIAGLYTPSGYDYYEIEMRAHTVSGFGEAYTIKISFAN